MTQLQDIVQEVRSKNAGPFWVTLEIFCTDDETFNRIKASPNLTKEKIAELYQVNSESMKRFDLETIRVIKYSFPRKNPSGHKYENDMHFGQQYVRLAEVVV